MYLTAVCNGKDSLMEGISSSEALAILNLTDSAEILEIFAKASALREKRSGKMIKTCSIVNAKCGNCAQNCAFCAQSSRSKAAIKTYPLISAEEMFQAAKTASEHGAHRFGIVTSGTKVVPGHDLDEICRAVRMIRAELPILPCASLGIMTEDAMLQLKDAGLDRYHHNLEAAPSYFPKVCTTRPYSTQTETVRTAKKLGFSVCSGGLFGIGESKEQRIELLETIRSLDVDSVPMNFLSPIPGTLLENGCGITAMDCLLTIAAARLMLPDTGIRICGGREHNLRDMQSWIFAAGADSFMTGGYLVTPGRTPQTDLQLIHDAGLELAR